MKKETLTYDQANQEFGRRKQRGKWDEVLREIDNGRPMKISELTTGELIALYNKCKKRGYPIFVSYKNKYAVIMPKEQASKEA